MDEEAVHFESLVVCLLVHGFFLLAFFCLFLLLFSCYYYSIKAILIPYNFPMWDYLFCNWYSLLILMRRISAQTILFLASYFFMKFRVHRKSLVARYASIEIVAAIPRSSWIARHTCSFTTYQTPTKMTTLFVSYSVDK